MGDNMVKKEECLSISLIVEGRDGINQLGEVINNHNDVFMVIEQRRVEGHEFNH